MPFNEWIVAQILCEGYKCNIGIEHKTSFDLLPTIFHHFSFHIQWTDHLSWSKLQITWIILFFRISSFVILQSGCAFFVVFFSQESQFVIFYFMTHKNFIEKEPLKIHSCFPELIFCMILFWGIFYAFVFSFFFFAYSHITFSLFLPFYAQSINNN